MLNCRLIKKTGRRLIFTFVSLFIATSAQAEPTSLLISDNDWKPWYFAGVTKGKQGFAKDVIGHCVNQAGYIPKFRLFPIERMKSMMKKGQMEGAIFSFKPHRKSFLIYSGEPIFRESYVPFVRTGSGTEIKRIEDFDNLRLGHLHGLSYSRQFFAYIQKRRNGGSLDVTTSGDANIQKLVSGKIDAFVDTIASVRWRTAELGLSNRITDADFIIRSADYFFVLSRASRVIADKVAFMTRFDKCVRNLKKTNRYSGIAAKYGMTVQDLQIMKN
jgi:polar amino acid transport system substrate-binding protein